VSEGLTIPPDKNESVASAADLGMLRAPVKTAGFTK